MKRVLLVGGPCDGYVRCIDDGVTTLQMKRPRAFNIADANKPVDPGESYHRYVEVIIGEQKPLRVFKWGELQDDDILHLLATCYDAQRQLRRHRDV